MFATHSLYVRANRTKMPHQNTGSLQEEQRGLCNCEGTQRVYHIGQPIGVGNGTISCGCCRRTDFEDPAPGPPLATKVRPDRTLVAVGPAGSLARGSAAWDAGT